MRRHLLAAAAFLAIALPASGEDPPSAPLGAPPAPPPFSERAAFLGVSGVDVAVDLTGLDGLGVAWAQTDPVPWDRIQPRPPIEGRVLSDWNVLDVTVSTLQREGFAPLLTLSPKSAWASQPADQTDWARSVRERLPAADATLAIRSARGVAPPLGEHWKAWQEFVRAVVERYDADGQDDAPGLLRPVLEVQILDRFQDGDHWLGSADELLRLLHHAADGAGQANAACEVVHPAVDLRGLFRAEDGKGDLWKDRLTTHVPAIPALLRFEAERGIELLLRSLEMPSLYRAMPHVGSGNHHEDALNVRALRGLLDARGSTNVPVWLTGSPARRLAPPRVPLPGAGRPTAVEHRLRALIALAESEPPLGEPGENRKWLDAATAADVVRGAALARAAGAARVLVEHDAHELFFNPHPVWFAVRQMNALLLGHRSASEAPLGAPGTAVVCSFGERAPLPWVAVLLLDDGGRWGGEPGKLLPTTRVQVPLPPGDVDIEEIALVDGAPKRRRARVVEGLLTLDLTPAPVYVFPAR